MPWRIEDASNYTNQTIITKGIDPQLDPNELKHLNAINSKLPNNMRISDCLIVEEFKLTENGKMNKKYYLKAVQVFLEI